MFEKADNLIKNSKHITLFSHIKPDCDTIGSMLALGITLKNIGKKISYFNPSKDMPLRFDFLQDFTRIKNKLPNKMDLAIYLDCASYQRASLPRPNCPIINFDHHKSNTLFADVNIVKDSYVSTSMIVFEFLKDRKYKIDKNCATALYAALAEDSGYFKYERTDQKSFETAKELVSLGAKPEKIATMLNYRNSLSKIRLMQLFLSSLELKHYAKIAITKLFKSDFLKCGASLSDSEDFVQIPLTLATVEVSVFAYEIDDNLFKISLRSKNDNIDCSVIASRYGGGGHKKASGFTAKINQIDDIIDMIVNDISSCETENNPKSKGEN